MNAKEIVIVAGLGRCGSSLVMQMLAAAGITCAGQFPSFEPDEMLESPSEAFLDLFEGGALKLIDPHRFKLPAGRAYRFIFLTRSRRQQALSKVKFLTALGHVRKGPIMVEDLDHLRESLRRDQELALRSVQAHACPILRVRFEDLIDRSDFAVPDIVDFLDLDTGAVAIMLNAIRPRPLGAQCYPGLLELELIKEAESRIESEAMQTS
jgi:hypothetical protein